MAKVFINDKPDLCDPCIQFIYVGVKRYTPEGSALVSCRKVSNTDPETLERAENECLLDTIHGIPKQIRIGFTR